MLHISRIAGVPSAHVIVLMSFTHTHIISNLYDLLSSVEHIEKGYCKNFLSLCLLTLYGISS